MDKEVLKNLIAISERISAIDSQLSMVIDMLNEERKADIDYIAMETGIELDQEEENE